MNIQGWRGTKSGRIAAVAVATFLVAFSLPIGGAGASGFTATANQNVNERSCKAATTSCATGFMFVGGTSVPSNNWTTGAQYTACGGISTRWTTIYRPTRITHVANRCVTVNPN